jgi:hypothetical protein
VAVCRTGFVEHTDHLWNHIASALDEDLIAYTDVFALNFVFVVQRGPTDGDASDAHWFEISRWR